MIILLKYKTSITDVFKNCVIFVPKLSSDELKVTFMPKLNRYGIRLVDITNADIIQCIDFINNNVYNLKHRSEGCSSSWVEYKENNFEFMVSELRVVLTNKTNEILFDTTINCNGLDVENYIRALDEIHQDI